MRLSPTPLDPNANEAQRAEHYRRVREGILAQVRTELDEIARGKQGADA